MFSPPPPCFWHVLTLIQDIALTPVQENFGSHVKGIDRPTNTYPTSIQVTKRWLDECRASHKSCKAVRKSPDCSVVTRLLRIAPDAKSLCLQDHLPSDTQYATLSHCWGKLDILRLTKATLEEFHLSIPLEKLCRTFQDAILVTRGVGLEYLWIDSLCIVQDDDGDWLAESALMGSIYNGSSLNIAAVSARDGNGGLYLPNPDTPDRAKASRFQVNINERLETFQFADSRTYTRCVTEEPLVSRGWTVQERILSPRTVYFSRSEAFWECAEKNASETLPDGFPDFLLGVLGYLKPTQKLSWSDVVRIYSTTNLTNPRDKLIALSGVARHIQKSTKDHYLAGLWLQDLIHTLGWSTTELPAPGTPLKPRPAVYRAPTWSWASTDSEISFPNIKIDEPTVHRCISILDYHIEASAEHQFGEVTGGTLTLSCEILLSCKFGPKDKDPYSQLISLRGWEILGKLAWDCDFGPQATRPRQYVFLVMEMYLETSRLFWLEGLVLCPSGNRRGRYERLGHLSVKMPSLKLDDARCRIENMVPSEEDYRDTFMTIVGQRRRYVVDII